MYLFNTFNEVKQKWIKIIYSYLVAQVTMEGIL